MQRSDITKVADPLSGQPASSHAARAAAPTKTGRSAKRSSLPRGLVYGVASPVIVIAVWWFTAAVLVRSESLLPLPSSVWQALVEDISGGSLWLNTWASLQRVFVGFAIAVVTAIPVGLVLGWYRVVQGLVEPIIQFLRVIPPIAIIPLVIVYLGIGESAKIFLIWFSAFLTIVISVYGGIRSIDATLIRAGRVLGAKDVDIFLDIAIPASIPFIFVGMRLGLATAWSTLVAAELIASSEGLGFLIIQSGQYRDLARVLLGITIIGVIGLLMDRLILALDKRLTRWQEREER